MQGNDFVQSLMYTRGVTCATCHDVHGTANNADLRRPAATVCLQCHGPASPNGPHTGTIEQHTHHKAGSPGNECVACHMPKIAQEDRRRDGAQPHLQVHPAVGDRNLEGAELLHRCHTDKSNAWATEALKIVAGVLAVAGRTVT